ncbi:hypothetical protein FHS00_003451 [Limimaricola variabilis]|uniref:Uncharacterized protein n=1 Tax=Limimaricola variabilis TaxID=1492771 RepID=A0ABR6HTG6_9RHOB|nr:hypothetical protein [Limimaricola variabilis]MBB3713844.1 hypothetical protein [Limimaricola variabilis]
MFRAIFGTAVAILFGFTSSAKAQSPLTEFFGVDFTSPYSADKIKIDTMSVNGRSLSLFQIDMESQGKSYLVETDAGEICEFVTVTGLENAGPPTNPLRLLMEMRMGMEDIYGPPTESSGPVENMPNDFTWLEGGDGARLPPEVAKATLALGFANGVPVAIFLKASHRRCAHFSAFGLP